MRFYIILKVFVGVFFCAAFSAVFLFSGQAEAKVQGLCSSCHTMHNSQNGRTMVIDSQIEGGVATDTDCSGCHEEPRENLLTYSCIGCHAINASSGDGIASLGGGDVPQVYYADTTESKELAAGNFIHIVNNDWTYGHNVHGFQPSGIDPDVDSITPPGYDDQMDPSTNKYDTWPYSAALSPQMPLCAGTYGCHGNRHEDSQTMAMIGSHHSDDSALRFGTLVEADQGGTPGTSYRFLSGVKGGEDEDWEYTQASNDHNEYLGADVGARTGNTSQSAADVDTMSEFCAECHGIFHMTGLSDDRGISPTDSSPWIRHPSDFVIPNTAPYNAYLTYELTARVARTAGNIPTTGASSSTDISSGTAVVFCLSCHKAHASRQPDMLRYSYDAMTTGSSSSSNKLCFACHTDK